MGHNWGAIQILEPGECLLSKMSYKKGEPTLDRFSLMKIINNLASFGCKIIKII
jgi:hypothetical protein